MFSALRPFLLKALRCLPLLAVVVLAMGCDDAFAQAKTFTEVQKNIGNDISRFPRVVAMLSYVGGAFFAASGLLRLKDWMSDSERNSLNTAMFRLVVASLLIYLPHAIVMANNTLFGDGKTNATTSGTKIKPPQITSFGKVPN